MGSASRVRSQRRHSFECLLCFHDYAAAFIAGRAHPDLSDANHDVIAQFVAHGFAGAIKAWLSDSSVTKADLIDASVACAPVWW